VPKKAGMNSQNQKCKNRGLLLKLICTGKEPSRIQLSQATGLTKMAVTNIISELMEQGYVEEGTASLNTGVGRNPIILTAASNAPKIIGVHISRDGCYAGLFDLKLQVLAEEVQPFASETQESIIEKLFTALDRIYAKEHHILGCGISIVGPLDVLSGMVLNPPDFFGIVNLPLVHLLSQRYHFDVLMNNDMNGAALAEKLYGAGKKYHNFLYVGISHGIGSGIISEDRLFQNGSGFVGELGHTSIDCQGELCACGRKGCLECYISEPVMLDKLKTSTGWQLSFREFCQRSDDPRVDAILTDMVCKLSYALVNQVNLLNPQAIFIGHEGSFVPDRYISFLEKEINCRKFSQDYLKIRVEKSPFGVHAPLYGSACLVLDRFFENGGLEEEPN